MVQTITPAEFSDSYHRAHRSYALATALLLAWEYIGVQFAETPVPSLNLKLTSPESIPMVLLALVAYFAIKYMIEWYQTPIERRQLATSAADWYLVHILALLALGTYFSRELFRWDLRASIGSDTVSLFSLGFVVGFFLLFRLKAVGSGPEYQNQWRLLIVSLLLGIVIGGKVWATFGLFGAATYLGGALVIILAETVTVMIERRRIQSRFVSTPEGGAEADA